MALVVASARSRFQSNWKTIDQSNNYILEHEIQQTMLSLPLNAVVLLRGDHITNVMRYVKICVYDACWLYSFYNFQYHLSRACLLMFLL